MNSLVGKQVNDNFVPSPLTTKEIDLYLLLLEKNMEFSSLDSEKRAEYINSNVIRKKIREALDITAANYNNLIARLSEKYTVFGSKLYDNGVIAKEFDKNIINYEALIFSFKTENS